MILRQGYLQYSNIKVNYYWSETSFNILVLVFYFILFFML